MTIANSTFLRYGTALALAVLLALPLFASQVRKRGLKSETVPTFAFLGIAFGLIGARLMYLLLRLSWWMEKGWMTFFAFRDGGFMMIGALLGALLAAAVTAKWTKQRFGAILDAAAAPLVLVLGLSRLAENLVGQGYGWAVGDWFSVDAFDPEEYTGMSLFHLEDASFFERYPFAVADPFYGQFCWAVAVPGGLVLLGIAWHLGRLSEQRTGETAQLGIAMVLAATLLYESLRQDAVLRWGFVRMTQVLGALGLGLLLGLAQYRAGRKGWRAAADWAKLLGCLGLIAAMEFALEKKIMFLEWMPMDCCYAVMALACVLVVCTLRPALLHRGGNAKREE